MCVAQNRSSYIYIISIPFDLALSPLHEHVNPYLPGAYGSLQRSLVRCPCVSFEGTCTARADERMYQDAKT